MGFLYDSQQWKKDLDEEISVSPFLTLLENKSILITGATGLICSSIVDILLRYNNIHTNHIQILAAGRSEEKMKERFNYTFNRPDFTFVPYDAEKIDNELSFHADYIIHGASNAFPAMIVKEPVETMLSNFLGLKYLLDFAREQGTKRLLYVSSSEVYGRKDNTEPFKEDEYGFIDLLMPRNAYSVGKRAAETLCVSYAGEYGVESVIVRPGHIYGPTASKSDNRVSSAWAYAVARGEDLIMKSDGSQLRSYCYCLDCASAILTVLLKGENVHAYNISNPDSIVSIKDMGEMLADAGGVKLIREEATEEDKKGFNPMTNSYLDSTSLLNLGWRGLFDAERGFSHTVKILKEVQRS